MKIELPFMPENWNDYINAERRNLYIANNIKQREKRLVKLATIGKRYTGNYPVELIIKAHFDSKRQDLDNLRTKGIIDGLVASNVIRNDNLTCIQKITLIPVFDNEKKLEIEIKEL